jgi:DNA-binding NarL/FixJ family response regulator
MTELTGPRLRLLIADDHPVFRSGLRSIIESVGDMVVVGEAATGLDAVQQAAAESPDVILMDLHMPEMGGIEATRRILTDSPATRVLVLTMLERDDAVFAAMRAGARGYLVKGSDRAEVLRAVRAVGAGDAIFSSGIADRLPALLATGPAAARSFPDLTDRERQILEQLARGRTNAEIAAELVISLKTVRNHVSNIFMKLGVAGRAQAIVKARDAGIVQAQSEG